MGSRREARRQRRLAAASASIVPRTELPAIVHLYAGEVCVSKRHTTASMANYEISRDGRHSYRKTIVFENLRPGGTATHIEVEIQDRESHFFVIRMNDVKYLEGDSVSVHFEVKI